MQVDLVQKAGDLLFSLLLFDFIFIPIVLLSILIMHFLMPKQVLERYLKPPYFREFECLFFTGIPYAPIRTVMFMRAIAYPGSGKKRGITEAHLLVPKWYRLISKVLIISALTGFILMIIFMVGMGVIYLINEI
jgi:hypothetical protein